MRRRQQSIDLPLVGVRPLVGDEGRHLVAGRRQAGEVERDPTQRVRAIGLARRFQPRLAELGQDQRSTGFRTKPGSSIVGTSGLLGARNDQCPWYSAPCSIQAFRVAI